MDTTKYQRPEHYPVSIFLTLVGGFLESYSYMTRNGVFANAQTGNICRLAMALAGGELGLVLRYLLPICAFVAGVTLSMQIRIPFRQQRLWGLRWQQWVVVLEVLLLGGVGLVPARANDLWVTVTIAFVCALQVESFRRFYGNAFASTMCTGNLRSATENLNHYWETKDPQFRKNGLMYLGVELTFILGVILGCFVTRALGTHAVWLTLPLLGVVFCLMIPGDEVPAPAGQATL